MTMTRRPWFWVAHSVFFLLCLFYVWKNFYRSFPFVELEVRMDRASAVRHAGELASQRGWAPRGRYHPAVSFDIDSTTQNFIELEAGGPQALRKVLQDGYYTPYTWRVRHFAEGQTHETQIRFTPEGKAFGFWEKIAETDPGPALKPDRARAIAERAAIQEWQVDFAQYKLVEVHSEERKSKRVDHEFIYERTQEQVGEGKYRLKLEVSGDRLTGLGRTIKVPEAFGRRYAAMRSENGTIASLAGAAVALLYGLGFCGIGLLVLARQRWIQWRVPVLVAGVISGLQFLDHLNRFPLLWMSYDTAISTQAFVARQAAGALLGALFDFVIVVIPLIAGETMSRKAFGSHPQLWAVFSRQAAATKPVVGRVLGAYLMAGFHFAWVVWIYRLGSERLGWWNPSELLFHPDALASYLPWLTSVSSSLHAGVWEECLFRAVPLAGAALLGERYGRRGVWLAVAFLVQAVVFGAAHASYPTQPSYARLVELLVPSTVFGGVYLAFGLLPSILIHYVYDVVLFAMPIFLSSGETAAVNQAIVLFLSGLPIWIPLLARHKTGRWGELPAALYNRGWRPSPVVGPEQGASRAGAALPAGLSPRARKGLVVAGALGLALWVAASSFRADAPGLRVSREQAVRLAREALEVQGVKLGAEWTALASVDDSPDVQDVFVWSTSGKEVYRRLLGTYLSPPQWKVRFARFEGDIVARAEEYQVFVQGSGEIERTRHELPESKPGATLGEKEARRIAEREVLARFGINASQLMEVSSNHYQLPGRRDWAFVWRDPSQRLEQGEARVAVRVSGDQAASYRRYVHVPEEWARAERSRRTVLSVARMLGGAGLAVLVLWIGFMAFRGWVQGRIDHPAFVRAFVALLACALLLRLNEFPEVAAQFSTAQSWGGQALRAWISGVVLALVGSAIAAVCLGRAHNGDLLGPAERRERTPWLGYGAGFLLAAVGALGGVFDRADSPVWPPLGTVGAHYPWFEAVQELAAYAGGTAFLMLLFPWVDSHVSARKGMRPLLFAALALASGAFASESSVLEWLGVATLSFTALFAVHELVRRTTPMILVPMCAVAVLLRAIRHWVLQGYPGAAGYGLIVVVGAVGLSWVWFGRLNQSGGQKPPL